MAARKLFIKSIVVGDGGVGKSTMIQRLITGKYIAQKITIGTDLATYDLESDGKKVTLQIWDFAGEKRFRFFLPNYSRGAMGCLLCYDISRYTSFDNLKEWYDIVKENANDPVFVLVGGKKDLEDRRVVSREDAKAFQDEYNIDYFFETSSKSGDNNKKIFQVLANGILDKFSL